jgi:hypothetical protein
MNPNKDDRVFFRFKELKNPNIEYHAHYSPPGKIVGENHWLSLTAWPDGSTHFHRDSAWNIFRENTTFDNILRVLRSYNILDIIHSEGKPDFSDYEKWPDHKFLKELSLHPEWLDREDIARWRLIYLIKTAGEANSRKGREAQENLKYHLIPLRQSGSKSYPVNLRGGLFLLKDLAKFLGKKCKQTLVYYERHERNELTDDDYMELQYWAKTEEPRILDMPKEDVLELVFRPVLYAEIILSKKLYLSLSTLKTKLYK